MLFNGEFYKMADELHAELDRLMVRYPTLFMDLGKLSGGLTRLDNSLRNLAQSMVDAREAMIAFSEAMDQSNPDDSGTQGTLAYSGRQSFLYHIGRIARAMFRIVSGQG